MKVLKIFELINLIILLLSGVVAGRMRASLARAIGRAGLEVAEIDGVPSVNKTLGLTPGI
jgi:hypothetical protein